MQNQSDRRRQTARDAALSAVPPRQRERLLESAADHNLQADDPTWVLLESVIRARASADAAEAILGEIREILARLPLDIQGGAAGALRGAAREVVREVADTITAPALAAIRDVERRAIRVGRMQSLAAGCACATVMWVVAALTAAPVLRLPISTRLLFLASAPAWPLALIEVAAVVAVVVVGRSK